MRVQLIVKNCRRKRQATKNPEADPQGRSAPEVREDRFRRDVPEPSLL